MKTHGHFSGTPSAADWGTSEGAHAKEQGHGHAKGPKRPAPRASTSRAARARRQRSGGAAQPDEMEQEPIHQELEELQDLSQYHPKLGHKALRRRRRGAQTGGGDIDDAQDDDSDSIALMVDEENQQSLAQLVLAAAPQDDTGGDAQSDERGRGAPIDRLAAFDGTQDPIAPPGAAPRRAPFGAANARDAKGAAAAGGFRPPATAANGANGLQGAQASLLRLMRANQRAAAQDGTGGTSPGNGARLATLLVPGGGESSAHAAMRIVRHYLTTCHAKGAAALGTLPPPTLDSVKKQLIASATAQRIEPVPCAQLDLTQQRFNLLLPLWMLQLQAPRQSVHHGSAIARLRSLGAK